MILIYPLAIALRNMLLDIFKKAKIRPISEAIIKETKVSCNVRPVACTNTSNVSKKL